MGMGTKRRTMGEVTARGGKRPAEACLGNASPAYPKLALAHDRVGFLAVSDGGRSVTIMVGPVRGPEHLEVIRTHRFYHAPASAIAASRLAVPFIAFYESASRFKREAGLIREYAEVLKVTRVRRGDLPGLTWPGRQGEDAAYYRFDLGPLLSLPRAITNPEQLRVVFRFPDIQRFHRAETLRDLGGSPDRDRRPRPKSGTPRKGAGKT
jgi:hypothetical protein